MLNKAVFMCIFICTVIAATHLDDGLGSHGAGFFTALAMAYIVLGLHACYLGYRLERAHRVCYSDGVLHFLVALVFLMIGWMPLLSKEHEKAWRCVGIGLSFVGTWLARHYRDRVCLRQPERDPKGKITKRGDAVPIHIELMHERMALMIVIVLGESVLGIILPELQQNLEYFCTVGLACVLICCIQYLYFEVDALRFTKHAMQRRYFTCCFRTHPAFFWLQGHYVLMVANLMVGVGIKSCLSNNAYLKPKYRILLASSTAGSLLLSYGLHLLHRLPSGFQHSKGVRGLVRVLASGSIIAVGLVPMDGFPAWAFMLCIALITMVLALYEFHASSLRILQCPKFQQSQTPQPITDSIQTPVDAPKMDKPRMDSSTDECRSSFELDDTDGDKQV